MGDVVSPDIEYEYAPLGTGDIRVIELLPGSHHAKIRFRLRHQRLTPATVSRTISKTEIERLLPRESETFKTPEGLWLGWNPTTKQLVVPPLQPKEALDHGRPFEALSYTWGDLHERRSAYLVPLADDGPDTVISITPHLELALQHLRLQDSVRRLWVDGICIDQANDEERSAQVLQMHAIFGQASRVIIWLGVSDSTSELALQTLQHLGSQIEISPERGMYPAIGATEPDWYQTWEPLPFDEHQWSAIVRLFARPWFRRLWVIQEVAVANQHAVVRCGMAQIDYCHFRRAIAGLYQRASAPPELADHVKNKAYLAYGLGNRNLIDLLYIARKHECQQLHDRVYGLLSLLGPQLRALITPSYELSYIDVYKDVLLNSVLVSRRLDLLTKCQLPYQTSNLPSWVPDWQRLPSMTSLSHGFQASGISRAIINHTVPHILETVGNFHGQVTTVKALPDSSAVDSRLLGELLPPELRTESYPTGEVMMSAWIRTLFQDKSKERFPCSRYESAKQWISSVLAMLQPDSTAAADVEQIPASEIPDRARKKWSQRMLFQTSQDYIGLGPAETLPGDCVSVILGCYSPLLLRPMANGAYQVVGSCYVHGLMDSESLLGPLQTHYSVQQHKIKGHYSPRYHNTVTGAISIEDPRLDELSKEWERVDIELTPDDPLHVDHFRNAKTNETINHDPRLLPEALRRRGVPLQIIQLI